MASAWTLNLRASDAFRRAEAAIGTDQYVNLLLRAASFETRATAAALDELRHEMRQEASRRASAVGRCGTVLDDAMPSEAKRETYQDLIRIVTQADGLKTRHRLPKLIETAFDYWSAKRGSRHVPERAEFDPAELPGVLPNLILWNVRREDGGKLAFECRTAGTRICDLAGRELRGISVEEMHWDAPGKISAEFRHVAETGEVHYAERTMQWTRWPLVEYRRLLMPMLGQSGNVEFLLGCLDVD
jgi:hypothetical protein